MNIYNSYIDIFSKIDYNLMVTIIPIGGLPMSAMILLNTDMWANLITFVPIILIFVVMYFFMIRPQKKQEKEANNMRNNLQVGDEVTTNGGIIGKIVSIKDETCVIETTKDRTRIRILKIAIARVDVKAEDAKD